MQKFFRDPTFVELVGGNLARHAQVVLIEAYCGKDLLAKEALKRKIESMRTDLAGPNPAPLERLLVERVVSGWLHLSYLELIYNSQKSMTLSLAMHYQRCITLAQKRYLAAIKMLAQVRKVMGLVIDSPPGVETAGRPATVLPLVRRAANAPAVAELSNR
jgi:hypothetical protein